MIRPLVLGEKSQEAIQDLYNKESRTMPLSNVEITCATFVWLTIPQSNGIEIPFSNPHSISEQGLPQIDLLPTERFVECYPNLGYTNPVSLRTFLNKMSEGKHPFLRKAGATKNPTYQVIPELYSIIRSEMVASLSMPHFSLEEIKRELKEYPAELASVFSRYPRILQADFVRDVSVLIKELKSLDLEQQNNDGQAENPPLDAVSKSLDDYLVVNQIVNRLLTDETFLRLLVAKIREKYGTDGLNILLGHVGY